MHTKRIVIIGGGIAGLAAAYRCEQVAGGDVAVTLIEREPRLGGKILTERADGFVVEGAPDSFLSRKPRGVGLCQELGLASQLHGRRPEHEKTFVRRHGQLHRLPSGLTGMIPTNLDALSNSTLISPAGRNRLAQEATLPPVPANGDESVAHFVTRRLGSEVYEQLVEPLMSGIYAGDGDQLSLAATFPQLRQLELKHGSLLRGLTASASSQTQNPPYPPFVSLPGGMATLVETIQARLSRTVFRTGVAVECVCRQGNGYSVALGDGATVAADAVILATPAFVTARLLADLDPLLADLHAQIPYASAAIVSLAFAERDLSHPLDGYGYVIPQVEGTDLLACTWTSSKWDGRVPAGHALLRVYAGRYGRRDVTQLSDDELLELARAEVESTLGVTALPNRMWIHRWPNAMPQYLLGHPERLAQIEQRLAQTPGLFLAGAAYRGVGIPDCIESGERAAAAALKYSVDQK
ncbi:MAG: protoporphyrinogen oxidase [Chloroflexi bacterium]|nr:MAG: protoporphyrinogen oxidase [Chloroflexota bacterium]